MNFLLLITIRVNKLDGEAFATLPPITSCSESTRLEGKCTKETWICRGDRVFLLSNDRWGVRHVDVQWESARFEEWYRNRLYVKLEHKRKSKNEAYFGSFLCDDFTFGTTVVMNVRLLG